MTAFLQKCIWLLVVMSSQIQAASEYRIVASASTLAEFESYQPFFHSRIFSSDAGLMTITNARAVAFATETMLYYSSEAISAADIVAAQENKGEGRLAGLLGASYRGVVLNGKLSELLGRDLGADTASFAYQTRTHNGKTIFAFSRDKAGKVQWPKSERELLPVPAVLTKDNTSGATMVAFGRLIGDASHRLGLVDKLLEQKNIRTDFIELGTNHQVNSPLSVEYVKALKKRNPSAVMLGTYEMGSLVQKDNKLDGLPVVYPFGSMFQRPAPRVEQKKEHVYFWSATGKENLWPLYKSLGQQVDVSAVTDAMKKRFTAPDQALNIVRAFSDEAARELARSRDVDVVLLVDPFEKLAAREIIEIKHSDSDSQEQVSPIVKVSYFDITEVLIKGKTLNDVQSVDVRRHPISDFSPRAKDMINAKLAQTSHGLNPVSGALKSAAAWDRELLEKTLGGIMLKEGKAHVAIVESLRPINRVEGTLPVDVAVNLMSPEGAMATVSTTGKQLKKIAALIKSKELKHRYLVFGMDDRGSKVAGRAVNDNERFTVALSEAALFELFGFSRLGGLQEEYAIRAPFVEAIYGDMKGMYFIGGPKAMPISDTVNSIEDAVQSIHAREQFRNVVARGLATMDDQAIAEAITYPQGIPHHVVTFEIAYFDIGISKNFVNRNYENQGKPADQGGIEKFPTSRAAVDQFAHLFLFAKTALKYDAPKIELSLTGEVKFMQTNVDKKPEKDKTKIGIIARLPWEKDLMKDSAVVVSPLLRSIYETKLVPSFWSKPTPEKDKNGQPIPEKPRTQRIDTLLGANINFTRLGFNMNVGGVLATDFTRARVIDAFDVGPGIDFLSKWSLFGPLELSSDISAAYLFALPGNKATNKIGLTVEGTVWLRFARVYDFSVSAMSDFMIGATQESPSTVLTSSIFGITVSYGRLFRLFG